MKRILSFVLLLALAAGSSATGAPRQQPAQPVCAACEEWNRPHRPLRIWGNTWYVGTEGLSAILVTSPEGHVLIDGALPESAPLVMSGIRSLGFRVEDVKLILSSHAHFDHSGGIAALQQASGAGVAASPVSARTLARGASGPEDPQYGELLSFPAVKDVDVISDGEVLRVGSLALTAYFTPGHTAGGTSWSWRSCQDGRCLDVVYADSLTPVSAKGFLFSRNEGYPSVLADFERSFAQLERLPCGILLTPHPGASALWERLDAREGGEAAALIDEEACSRYAAAARRSLAKRVGSEK